MAVARFIDSSDFEIRLNRSATDFKKVAEKSIEAGAAVIAAKMRENLKGILPTDTTGQLIKSMGITPVKQDAAFNYNAHIGFDGYREPPYGKFPQGVPFQLIARSFESGVKGRRDPKPFAKPAVMATKDRVREVMTRVADEEFKKIMEGK